MLNILVLKRGNESRTESERNHAPSGWPRLKEFVKILDKGGFHDGPIRETIKHFAEAITDQDILKAVEAKKSQLEKCFQDLSIRYSGTKPPILTSAVQNLCRVIKGELDDMFEMKRRNEVSTASSTSCHAIQTYFERLALNIDVETWKIDDGELAGGHSKSDVSSTWKINSSPENSPLHYGQGEVLDKLNYWALDDDPYNVFWLYGMNWMGRTVVMDNFRQGLVESNRLGAYVLCSALPFDRPNLKLILPTVSRQLSGFSLPLHAKVTESMPPDANTHSWSLAEQFETMIAKPLREVADTLPPGVVIVIDALDECTDHDGVQQVLDILCTRAQKLPIKIFVTSRSQPRVYDKISRTCSPVVMHNLDVASTSRDVESYLHAELSPYQSSPELSRLVASANKSFVYATTIVKYLKPVPGHLVANWEEILRDLLSASVNHNGEPIDALYDYILTSTSPHTLSDPQPKFVDLSGVRMIIYTVARASEPLTIENLGELLQLTDIENIIRPLHPLLDVSRTNRIITSSHESFSSYILDTGRSGRLGYKPEVHSKLAELCLGRIERNKQQFNIGGFESSSVFDDQVLELSARVFRSIPPDLTYACQYWAIHLVLGANKTQLTHALLGFLSTRLLLWMEVLNLKNIINIGGGLLERAEEWCTSTGCSDLIDFVRETWRFVSTFADSPVSRSTPHIYMSMLAMWPTFDERNSWVMKHYYSRTKGLVQVQRPTRKEARSEHVNTIRVGSMVHSVAFSPDCTRIASGSSDKRVRVWNAYTGELILGPLDGHTDRVTSVQFSSDAEHIVSGSFDKTIRLWSAKDGRSISTPIEGHTHPVTSVAFSPNGTSLGSGSLDKTVRVWNFRDLTKAAVVLEGHTHWINCIAFSPQGERVASGSNDGTVRIWDLLNGQVVARADKSHARLSNSVVFSPDISRLAFCSKDNRIHVWKQGNRTHAWDTVRYEPALELQGHTSLVIAVTFSPDGQFIASGSYDKSICIWNLSAGQQPERVLMGHTHWVHTVVFSRSGKALASGSWDKTVIVWDSCTGAIKYGPFRGHKAAVRSLAFTPDESCVASGDSSGTILVWDVQNGQLLSHPLMGHTTSVNSLSYAHNGAYLVSGSSDATIHLWDPHQQYSLIRTSHGHTGSINIVIFSIDSKHIVSGSSDGTIITWDSQSGEVVAGPFRGHTNAVQSLAFLPGSESEPTCTFVMSYSLDKSFRVWDTRIKHVVPAPIQNRSPVMTVAFSPTGEKIVSGLRNNTIWVQDAQTGDVVAGPLNGHTGCITSVDFSPDNAKIVSVSSDHTLCVFDTQSGRPDLGPLKGHSDRVTSVAFSMDGTKVISGSLDKTIRVWELRSYASSENSNTPIFESSSSNLPSSLHIISSSSPDTQWTLQNDGWIINSQAMPLIWLPVHLGWTSKLEYGTETDELLTENSSTLNFSETLIGNLWSDCYLHEMLNK